MTPEMVKNFWSSSRIHSRILNRELSFEALCSLIVIFFIRKIFLSAFLACPCIDKGFPFWLHSLIHCFIHKTGPALMIVQAKVLVMLLLEYVLVTLDLLGLIVLVRKWFYSMIFGWLIFHINCSISKTGPVQMIAQAKALVMPLLEHVLVTLDLLGLIVLVR